MKSCHCFAEIWGIYFGRCSRRQHQPCGPSIGRFWRQSQLAQAVPAACMLPHHRAWSQRWCSTLSNTMRSTLQGTKCCPYAPSTAPPSASARGTKSLASQRLNKCALLFSFGGFCGFGFSWNLCQKCSSFFPKFFDWACLAGRVFWQEGGGTFCSETFHRTCPLISLA